MLDLIIYAVKDDVASLTNLLWTSLLKFQISAGHKLFHKLSNALLLGLQVLFHVYGGSLRIITVALIGSFTFGSYLL